MENQKYEVFGLAIDTPKQQLMDDIKRQNEILKKEIEQADKTLWELIYSIVLDHLKLNEIQKEDYVKTIYYNGVHATVWSFTDKETKYFLRREKVSSNGGYVRYKLTINHKSFDKEYEADERCYRVGFDESYLIDMIEFLNNYSSESRSLNYKKDELEKLNKLIEELKK